jgi:hypothetical protein
VADDQITKLLREERARAVAEGHGHTVQAIDRVLRLASPSPSGTASAPDPMLYVVEEAHGATRCDKCDEPIATGQTAVLTFGRGAWWSRHVLCHARAHGKPLCDVGSWGDDPPAPRPLAETPPDANCTTCGAPRSKHTPAPNGGLDCPPRADGKVPVVVGSEIVGMDSANHCAITRPKIEWRAPSAPPREPISPSLLADLRARVVGRELGASPEVCLDVGRAYLASEPAPASRSGDPGATCRCCGGTHYTRHLGRDNEEIVEDCPDRAPPPASGDARTPESEP